MSTNPASRGWLNLKSRDMALAIDVFDYPGEDKANIIASMWYTSCKGGQRKMLFLPMPPSATEIAKYLISLVDREEGDSISNLKLQKLLYYAQGFHLAIFDKPLFHEALKKWAHGPVVPQVWHVYKEHGSGPIPVEVIDRNDYSPQIQELLNEVFQVYGQFSAAKLRNMTHNEPPWLQTEDNEVISHDLMKQFFKTLVIEDEEGQEQDQEAASDSRL